LVTDPVLDELLRPYRDQIFYLGHVYGSKPRLPLWFKHFDRGPDGAGEAFHLGIFGKTGSGKSSGQDDPPRLRALPEDGAARDDPQGEFARDMGKGNGSGEFTLPVGNVARELGKQPVVLTVRNLVLDRWELFEQILFESLFFERLTVPKGENRELACGILSDKLQKAKVKLVDLHIRISFDTAWKIYVTKGSRSSSIARRLRPRGSTQPYTKQTRMTSLGTSAPSQSSFARTGLRLKASTRP
jgi:hypothetical protein